MIFGKDIRCLLNKHKYSCGDMVVKYLGETAEYWKYGCTRRCVRCGKTIQETVDVAKPTMEVGSHDTTRMS